MSPLVFNSFMLIQSVKCLMWSKDCLSNEYSGAHLRYRYRLAPIPRGCSVLEGTDLQPVPLVRVQPLHGRYRAGTRCAPAPCVLWDGGGEGGGGDGGGDGGGNGGGGEGGGKGGGGVGGGGEGARTS